MPEVKADPSTPSSAYDEMKPYWDMVDTILNGTAAMREAGMVYLPKFVDERDEAYQVRRRNARFTNIYADVLANLASKPFAKEVRLKDESDSSFKAFAEDVDKSGNNLHVFASSLFYSGINDAVSYILVDMPPVKEGTTVADAKSKGLQPYWVHVVAKNVIAYYTDMVDGVEQPVHVRIREDEQVRSGWEEKTVKRIRVFDRAPIYDDEEDPNKITGYEKATWAVYEQTQADVAGKGGGSYDLKDSGDISIGVIAMVPFVTGQRHGKSWTFRPPMGDVAYLQIEYYQNENGLKDSKIMTCYPMLSGSGVDAPQDAAGNPTKVPVGPRSVLLTPPRDAGSPGEWKFIEPAATSLMFLAADLKADENRMRELGRQPLTAQSGNLTVVTTAFAAQKGNSAVQQWALLLKDSLENAFKFTGQFISVSAEPEVIVFTDFSAGGDTKEASTFLLALRKNGDISRKAVTDEAKRRDYLSAEYDSETDQEQLLEEERLMGAPEEGDETDSLDPITGEPLTEDGLEEEV